MTIRSLRPSLIADPRTGPLRECRSGHSQECLTGVDRLRTRVITPWSLHSLWATTTVDSYQIPSSTMCFNSGCGLKTTS